MTTDDNAGGGAPCSKSLGEESQGGASPARSIRRALAPAAWGAGLGTELVRALLTYTFDTRGLPEVHATVAAPNTASLTLLTRLGFTPVRDIEEPAGPTTRVLVRRR